MNEKAHTVTHLVAFKVSLYDINTATPGTLRNILYSAHRQGVGCLDLGAPATTFGFSFRLGTEDQPQIWSS